METETQESISVLNWSEVKAFDRRQNLKREKLITAIAQHQRQLGPLVAKEPLRRLADADAWVRRDSRTRGDIQDHLLTRIKIREKIAKTSSEAKLGGVVAV